MTTIARMPNQSSRGGDPVAQLRTRLGGIAFGGDYNPEQWDETLWPQDVALMREAGVNLVTVGVFAWSLLEPREGQYEFGWLDRILDLLHDNGILVCLATPTAAPPAWMAQHYPETLPVTAAGIRLNFGGRCHFCASSPVYRRKSIEIASALAARYGEHPALALWHINNEYGQDCYCDVSGDDFRRWLQDRYGSVDAVNRTWGTTSWGQVYTEWEQIDPPRAATGMLNPSRVLDYARFTSQALLECYLGEHVALREHSPGIPVTTNFMTSYKDLDYRAWARHEDIVSLDAYPDPAVADSQVEAAMNFDLARSLRAGQPWLLMEQATSAVNWRSRNSGRPPGHLRLGSLQAIARGADSAMFFQWRASRFGAERFHSAMVPHAGTRSRVWREVRRLGRDLSALRDVAGTRITARVAIVWDWESWWALEGSPRLSEDVEYVAQVLRFYRAMWRRNVAVDLVALDDDLTGYALVVVPAMFAIPAAAAAPIEAYVKAGGHLVVTYATGLVDESNAAHLGGYPGALRNVLGIRVEELNPLQRNASIALAGVLGDDAATNGDGDGDGVGHRQAWWAGSLWQDIITTSSSDVATVLTYADGGFAGYPAVTRNRFGRGEATYLGTAPDDHTFSRLVEVLLQRAGVQGCPAPPDVEVVHRAGGARRFTFLLNHNPTPVEVGSPCDGRDVLTGEWCSGVVTLAGYGVRVIRSRG